MEKPHLNDPAQLPQPDELKAVLKTSYAVYEDWLNYLNSVGVEVVWRFYRDGGAWLAKAVFKKKTLCWISVWDGFFKCTFYFTEKTLPGVFEADLSPFITEKLTAAESIGKLYPVTVDVFSVAETNDLQKLLNYKKTLK